jgi:hypothetical protein
MLEGFQIKSAFYTAKAPRRREEAQDPKRGSRGRKPYDKYNQIIKYRDSEEIQPAMTIHWSTLK